MYSSTLLVFTPILASTHLLRLGSSAQPLRMVSPKVLLRMVPWCIRTYACTHPPCSYLRLYSLQLTSYAWVRQLNPYAWFRLRYSYAWYLGVFVLTHVLIHLARIYAYTRFNSPLTPGFVSSTLTHGFA